jgi:hypothetical protein
VNGEYLRICKGMAIAYSPEETEKNHENLSQDSKLPS